jgi:hypothetical protein
VPSLCITFRVRVLVQLRKNEIHRLRETVDTSFQLGTGLDSRVKECGSDLSISDIERIPRVSERREAAFQFQTGHSGSSDTDVKSNMLRTGDYSASDLQWITERSACIVTLQRPNQFSTSVSFALDRCKEAFQFQIDHC